MMNETPLIRSQEVGMLYHILLYGSDNKRFLQFLNFTFHAACCEQLIASWLVKKKGFFNKKKIIVYCHLVRAHPCRRLAPHVCTATLTDRAVSRGWAAGATAGGPWR